MTAKKFLEKWRAGRPSKYSEEILPKVQEYLDKCQDKDGKVKLPTIEGLSVYLGVNRSTIYEWKKEHSEFSDMLEEFMSSQINRLINNGLEGNYNPSIAKLLMYKHGYAEKTENSSEISVSSVAIEFEEPKEGKPKELE